MLAPLNLMLEEESEKKRLRSQLDPWKTHFHPVTTDIGEIGGKQEGDEGCHQHENQIRGSILQQAPLPKKPSSISGKIIPANGGHIVRATGRKDRHSKVYTAKGVRDRRVRLSAHTAIQFYDVQDRLGYDRPSKAVDWLIKNAKAAIDQLDELPPWHPNATTYFEEQPNAATAPFLSPSLDSDAITQFNPQNLLSRASSQDQDLRLSLQSSQGQTPNILSASEHMGFDVSSGIPWSMGDNSDRSGGFVFSPQEVLGDSQLYTHREPLQSSNSPSMCAWNAPVAAATGHQMHHSLFRPLSPSVQDMGFASSSRDFSGFRIPQRIEGKEEHDARAEDKPESASDCHY
ncbi:uncharacterized protein A4U43_C05F18000 [Asparagus officinalis]|uniref:TCP domain-containing protein n=1 Tax=Asparagus officinalis TaxID=4686 RepID=A0A5P1EUZ2_ASPOF|nr:transcription factor TCP4-like [Asparagus officinalis]ONK68977.1 uncharacterized protein A4U43_C05F18000 [Asparagus officinalis]